MVRRRSNPLPQLPTYGPRYRLTLSASPTAWLLVHLADGDVSYNAGDELRHVYFPADAIVALACATSDGQSMEISVVGIEGMVGVSAALGGHVTPNSAIVRSPGSAYRLGRRKFQEEFNRHGAMLRLVLFYMQSLITQMGQLVACDRHHHVEQQVCRWLLDSLDRLPGNRMTVTKKRSAACSVCAGRASPRRWRRGLIEHHRGWITVLDRPGLEKLSCECYREVQAETECLLPHLDPDRQEPA